MFYPGMRTADICNDSRRSNIRALNVSALGANGIFCAILISLISVRITKFAVDHKWMIRMPDVVPEGILNSFNSIIPSGLNILFWYGLANAISYFTDGTMTLGNLITSVIATPLSYLVSPLGMIVIVIAFCLSWFFGIHGGSVVFTAIMPMYIAAYATKTESWRQQGSLWYSMLSSCMAV